jgi:hypothetical protein
VCDCAEEICCGYVADSIQSGWISVNMLKDNIEMYIKEMALMIARSECNLINTLSSYRHCQTRCLVETMYILPS